MHRTHVVCFLFRAYHHGYVRIKVYVLVTLYGNCVAEKPSFIVLYDISSFDVSLVFTKECITLS